MRSARAARTASPVTAGAHHCDARVVLPRRALAIVVAVGIGVEVEGEALAGANDARSLALRLSVGQNQARASAHSDQPLIVDLHVEDQTLSVDAGDRPSGNRTRG